MTFIKYLCLTLTFPLMASATDLITLTNGQETKSSAHVPISVSGKALDRIDLLTAGSGVRWKGAEIYVGQLLMEDPTQFSKTKEGALTSLSTQKVAAMHFTFVRSVDKRTIASGFEQALLKNDIDPSDDAEAEAFISMVGGQNSGDASRLSALSIVIEKNSDGSETLYYQGPSKNETPPMIGKAGLMRKIFSIWLGKPSDSGVAAFQEELLGVQP